MASNFTALWPKDPKFFALKDLNPLESVSKVNEASSSLRVGFALSKLPHLLHKMGFVDSLSQTTVLPTFHVVLSLHETRIFFSILFDGRFIKLVLTV